MIDLHEADTKMAAPGSSKHSPEHKEPRGHSLAAKAKSKMELDLLVSYEH